MPSFGERSTRRLKQAHPDLQVLCYDVIEVYDFSVLETYRSDERQEELFNAGKSKLRAGQSKHNRKPSHAIDIVPYPIDWGDARRFYLLAGFMFHAAHTRGINLRWGGDWDKDWVHSDQSFDDLPHFELMI